MNDTPTEDTFADIYEESPYIKEMQYENWPPTRAETVYFVPMTGKRLATIVYLLETHQIPDEKLTPERQESLGELRLFLNAMTKQHAQFYDAIFAPQSDTESDQLPYG